MEEETNMELNEMYQELGISPEVLKFGTEIEEHLKERFKAIDENAEFNPRQRYPLCGNHRLRLQRPGP